MIECLRHYFVTYKVLPGGGSSVSLSEPNDHAHVMSVGIAAIEDYRKKYEKKFLPMGCSLNVRRD